MAGILSTLRNTCKTLFHTLKLTLSTTQKWFYREVTPVLREVGSTMYRFYHTHARPSVLRILRFIQNHYVAIAVGILSIVVIVWPAVIVAPVLAVLGFGLMGPLAGSIAALTQSLIGNVAAGSLFATLESAGMAGFGLTILPVIIRAIAASILAAVLVHLVLAWREEKEKSV